MVARRGAVRTAEDIDAIGDQQSLAAGFGSQRKVSLLPAQLGLDDHLALRHGLVRKNTDRLLAVRRGGLVPQRQQLL